jgi:hypothetical protein
MAVDVSCCFSDLGGDAEYGGGGGDECGVRGCCVGFEECVGRGLLLTSNTSAASTSHTKRQNTLTIAFSPRHRSLVAWSRSGIATPTSQRRPRSSTLHLHSHHPPNMHIRLQKHKHARPKRPHRKPRDRDPRQHLRFLRHHSQIQIRHVVQKKVNRKKRRQRLRALSLISTSSRPPPALLIKFVSGLRLGWWRAETGVHAVCSCASSETLARGATFRLAGCKGASEHTTPSHCSPYLVLLMEYTHTLWKGLRTLCEGIVGFGGWLLGG